MSELYEHLKRLEEKEKRLRDEGLPASVPALRPGSPRDRKWSKALLLGIPSAFLALGLLTVMGVSALKKTAQERNPATRPEAQVPHVAQKGRQDTEPVPTPAPAPVPEKSPGAEALWAGLNQSVDGWIVGADGKQEGHASRGLSEEAPDVPPSTPAPAQNLGGPRLRSLKERPEGPKRSPKNTTAPKPEWGKEPPVETSRQALVIAEEARRAGDWEGAERGYREYLATRNDPTVLNNLGAVLMARGLFAEAEQVLTRAYDQSRDPDIAANLWASLWRQGKKEAACRLALSLRDDPSAARLAPAMSRLIHQCPPGP